MPRNLVPPGTLVARSRLVSAWVAALRSFMARTFAHPVALSSREMNSLRVRNVGGLLRKVPRLKLVGLKHNVETLTLSLPGKNRGSRRLVTKSIATRFNRV
jgi:hypothetical protein